MAELMQTSRARLDRLLDPDNSGTTLETLMRAAKRLDANYVANWTDSALRSAPVDRLRDLAAYRPSRLARKRPAASRPSGDTLWPRPG